MSMEHHHSNTPPASDNLGINYVGNGGLLSSQVVWSNTAMLSSKAVKHSNLETKL